MESAVPHLVARHHPRRGECPTARSSGARAARARSVTIGDFVHPYARVLMASLAVISVALPSSLRAARRSTGRRDQAVLRAPILFLCCEAFSRLIVTFRSPRRRVRSSTSVMPCAAIRSRTPTWSGLWLPRAASPEPCPVSARTRPLVVLCSAVGRLHGTGCAGSPDADVPCASGPGSGRAWMPITSYPLKTVEPRIAGTTGGTRLAGFTFAMFGGLAVVLVLAGHPAVRNATQEALAGAALSRMHIDTVDVPGFDEMLDRTRRRFGLAGALAAAVAGLVAIGLKLAGRAPQDSLPVASFAIMLGGTWIGALLGEMSERRSPTRTSPELPDRGLSQSATSCTR